MSTTVSIFVSRAGGDAYKARAGIGKAAKSASSTSDALTAALRAGAKWLRLPEREVIVYRSGGREIFLARPLNLNEVFTEITFEDHGQDFLTWLVAEDGTIYDCQPSQSWVWCGGQVFGLRGISLGGFVKYKAFRCATQAEDLVTIKYPVANIRTGSLDLFSPMTGGGS